MSRTDLDGASPPAGEGEPGLLPSDDIPPAGRLGQLVAGVLPIALGLAGLGYSVSLSLGTPAEAGPGLWPALASLLLLGAGLWSLVFERKAAAVEQFGRGGIGIALGVVSLVVFVLLINRIGFEIPTLLVMAFWLRVLGRESWRVTAVVSVVTTAALYLLFITLLDVKLPRLAF
ncbi:tripartite tricarboxylate transporter TctB family protein [Plantactinospora sp. CA-294935]|uniref:tripartite tricarboxylate transporter TctB family protein n=1 Tax=Plantactinospora sp. CA-294935 TaxID=3240012 RepID=UPI003D8A0A17